MSGEKPSLTPLAEWDNYLDSAESRIGVRGGPNTVFKYLEMSEAEMRSLSAEECGEAAAVLAALAFKLQREQNAAASRAYWCGEKLKRDLALEMLKAKAYSSFDERRGAALASNPDAMGVERERVAAEGLSIRLNYLPARLDKFVETFLALQATKRKHR